MRSVNRSHASPVPPGGNINNLDFPLGGKVWQNRRFWKSSVAVAKQAVARRDSLQRQRKWATRVSRIAHFQAKRLGRFSIEPG
jgi:hypothetical protein